MIMTILRQETKDYGGLEVWDSRDPDTPVYFADGVLNETTLDAVIAARAVTAAVEAKLDKINKAERKINGKVWELMDAARSYVEEHPSVTNQQLLDAFVAEFKSWASTWVGD